MSGDETLVVIASVIGLAIPTGVAALVAFGVGSFVLGWKRAAAMAGAAFVGSWIAAVAAAYAPAMAFPGGVASPMGRTLYPLAIVGAALVGGLAGGALGLRRRRTPGG